MEKYTRSDVMKVAAMMAKGNCGKTPEYLSESWEYVKNLDLIETAKTLYDFGGLSGLCDILNYFDSHILYEDKFSYYCLNDLTGLPIEGKEPENGTCEVWSYDEESILTCDGHTFDGENWKICSREEWAS